LLAAGFQSPQVTQVQQTWRLPSPDHLIEAMRSATVRTAGLLSAQSKESLQDIFEFVRHATKAYQKEGAIELPMPAMLATAIK
jgi:hypothetical protein